MLPISSIPSSAAAGLGRVEGPQPRMLAPLAKPGVAPADGFGQMLDGLVGMVQQKQAAASETTRRVLLGESDQLHQSMISMQEASVAFSLMVEVRNKLVESYQELMRMQA